MKSVALALLLLPAASPCGTDGGITLVTAEQGGFPVESIRISSDGEVPSLEYRDSTGTKKIRCDEVVEIRLADAAAGADPPPALVEMELTSGDRIVGMLAGGADSTIRLQTSLLGAYEARLENVKAVRSVRNSVHAPPRPEKVVEDLVFTRTGEQGKGTLLSLKENEIAYHSSLLEREVTVPIDQFVAAYPVEMPDAAPPQPPKTLYAILLSRDGSSLQGTLASLADGELSFRDLYGTERTIGIPRLASIYFRNGRVVYLSDLKPAATDENANYIRLARPLPGDLDIPWQGDRNALGGPLILRRKPYRKGIGVHAYSSLTYDLTGGGYRNFSATIALDDCGKGLGHVVFRIFADDVVKLERAMDAKDAPEDVSVRVEGAKSLRLVVDFGERANQGDYADWAGARLIR